MQKIFLTGNVGKAPETRIVKSGDAVCSFSVCVNERHNGVEKPTWFRVSAWGKLADVCGKYITAGRKVAVVGPVSVSSYEAKDGSGTKFTLEVRADDVEFLSPREHSDAAEPRAQAAKPAGDGFVDDDDLPF